MNAVLEKPKAAYSNQSAPTVVDMSAWYEQHDALLFHLLHMASKALARSHVNLDDEMTRMLAGAHEALRTHAKTIAGNSTPIVRTKDRKHTIDYDELAETRAKVKVLSFELNELRAKTCISNRYTKCPSTTPCISDRYTEGRRAMHTEIIGLLQRPIEQFKAAAKKYPTLAAQLDKAVHPLHVMLAKVLEMPVEPTNARAAHGPAIATHRGESA